MDNNTNSKTIFYFIGIVVALAILGWLFYSFGGSKMNQGSNSSNTSNEVVNTNKVVPPADATVKKNKSEIMSIVAKNRVLTQEERAMITSALNGDLINFYGFTEAEKKQIIDALNRQ
jgi:hypothetical protein